MDTTEYVQIGTLLATGVLVCVNIWLVCATRKIASTAEQEFRLARSSCVRAVMWRYDNSPTPMDTWSIRFDISEMVGIPTLIESVNIKSYWNDREDKAKQIHVPGIPMSVVKGAPVRVFVDQDRFMADTIVEDSNTSKKEILENRLTRPPIHELIIKGEFTYINAVDKAKFTVSFGATCRLANEPQRQFRIEKHPQIEIRDG